MIQSNDLFSKTSYAEDDLNQLIQAHTEESLYLEFKANGSLQMGDSKKNEIAKDISAFANSDGGILIYGINEINHIADSLSFVDGNLFTKEWLENVIQSRINRSLPNIEVHPIRFNGDFSKSVYIIKIARSHHAPHMTADKKYYRKLNFQVVQMEEYEIRDAYNRVNKTALDFDDLIISSIRPYMQSGRISEARYKINFQIKNIGTTIESQYKLEVYVPFNILTNPNHMHPYKIRNDDGIDVYSMPNTSPLFQNELMTVGAFDLVFNATTKELINRPIRAKLYFSGGMIEKFFSLNDKLLYLGNPLDTCF